MNKKILKKHYLPITDISQLKEQLAKILLWYDIDYCQSINGANEIIDEYLKDKTIEKPE